MRVQNSRGAVQEGSGILKQYPAYTTFTSGAFRRSLKDGIGGEEHPFGEIMA